MIALRPYRCAVVGAANIDIGGFPTQEATPGDSIPGIVRTNAGGVGHNIAANLARLGVETGLVCALGGDAFSGIVRADCADAGVGLGLSPVFPGAATSTYLYIADESGDMRLAVNDMRACDLLTPDVLEPRIDALNGMDAVVIEANLPEASIACLAEHLHVPLIADAVSAVKVHRLMPALPKLHAIKPNAREAEALTGIAITDRESALDAARKLTDMGVRRAYITLGARGVCCADADRAVFIPGAPLKMVNATGAGDAFTAALTWSCLRGEDLVSAALTGLAAAMLTAECPQTVSPDISPAALRSRLQIIKTCLEDKYHE